VQGLYPGCVAPLKTEITVTSDDDDVSLAGATGARIFFVFEDDTEAELTAEVSAISATSVTVTREHEADDIPEGSEGMARVWAEIDIPTSDEPLRSSAQSVPILRRGS
jgi:hypothetical protein